MAGRPYLSLQRVRVEDVPQHPEIKNLAANAPAPTTFLTAVFSEALKEDFETGFTVEGIWAPTGKNVKITGLEGGSSAVPVSVEQRKKGKGDNTWFARRSKHAETDVRHTELDALLMNDHSWWEYQYTPDLYDGNLLLEWDANMLAEAEGSLKQDLGIGGVEMRVVQMFHVLPGPLQDRVFHALAISGKQEGQSINMQIPIDYSSFVAVETIRARSRLKPQGNAFRYNTNANRHENREPKPTKMQQERSGKRVTEGIYASLERIRIHTGTEPQYTQWDMMTLSNAGGVVSSVPVAMQKGQLLEAVSKDVQFVIQEVGKRREGGKV
ncbi:uncharacterized protein M421DRAFT_129002 [Didymella exigua CBS 183.55]|uniref:DUF3074 domain-containing protein n=1 Tax=Didymella exigua CBS 183.55 TaxID=1150837 RepID=A0A6A5RQZ9_9PLEO|nr:uncharacterized protein M421DRAFT_129002 [Didymella exigua CBS 183.55]KAF1929760.1 hypothetical protein M421DRAFT_129002 [Didymella exigua CBS 183.55]